ncbi:peptide/nickel transport system permease protein [Halovenus aranensis]|uniref:Peptide/nickel transport system permease protein n=1 Tax=Halovenus aranensis TaxID=890420 RepID=A0A1G8SB69_9EURY|nr:ABC transporter permease [Halovenus aranensis]SDJ26005.1 peptide/nickel transport system permease protein [Halovenus aranensis]
MSRWRYVLKRLALSIPVVFSVITFLFLVLRLGPLDPVAARLGQQAQGADVQRLRENLGLDEPLWVQFQDYIVETLTFSGESWVVRNGAEVREMMFEVAGPTIWLGAWAIVLPLFIGLPLGFYAGLNPNTPSDIIANVSGIIWRSMPNFWLAVLALAFLRSTNGGDGPFGFNWYTTGPQTQSAVGTPTLNFATIDDIFGIPMLTGMDWSAFFVDLKLILPAAIILGSSSMAAELRLGRTAVLENVNSNYVETAKAKGLKGRTIVWKHVFRNALIPIIPIVTNEAFILIGGSVIMEQIFNINGLGRMYFRAIQTADVPLAGAIVFLFTVIIISLNILQDILYTIVDPRVGYDQ